MDGLGGRWYDSGVREGEQFHICAVGHYLGNFRIEKKGGCREGRMRDGRAIRPITAVTRTSVNDNVGRLVGQKVMLEKGP